MQATVSSRSSFAVSGRILWLKQRVPSYRRHRQLHITVISTLAAQRACAIEAGIGCSVPAIHRNPGQVRKSYPADNWRLRMLPESNDTAIDQIVARCNGDIRGALKALLLINEHLEAELQQVYAAVAHGARDNGVLH